MSPRFHSLQGPLEVGALWVFLWQREFRSGRLLMEYLAVNPTGSPIPSDAMLLMDTESDSATATELEWSVLNEILLQGEIEVHFESTERVVDVVWYLSDGHGSTSEPFAVTPTQAAADP